ncbi:MAG: hypothetical protein QF858_03210 [Candidatus Pacebacteria bacterium]|nr:hypothetical protein [Candidatus Paceibacterota bacterium]
MDNLPKLAELVLIALLAQDPSSINVTLYGECSPYIKMTAEARVKCRERRSVKKKESPKK